jgi:TRAP-type C4-dicarboxylate transport system permease small subunit
MKKAVEVFTRAHDALTEFGYYFGCLALAVIFSSYIIEVFGRYFFNAPQWWASEAVS